MDPAAPGVSLYETGRPTAVVVLPAILTAAASGTTTCSSGDGILHGTNPYYPLPAGHPAAVVRDICGIFPVPAGTAAAMPRPVHTQ